MLRSLIDTRRPEIEEMRRHPSIGGYVITEFTDVHWECNGLLEHTFHSFGHIHAATAGSRSICSVQRRSHELGRIVPVESGFHLMFRGLDGDDSIVIDSRGLRPGPRTAAAPSPSVRVTTPEPAALGAVDERHFGDLAQDDDETDFSGLASTSLPPSGTPSFPMTIERPACALRALSLTKATSKVPAPKSTTRTVRSRSRPSPRP